MPRHIRLAIAPVFALALAIVFSLFLAFIEFRSLPPKDIALSVAFVILISFGATVTALAAWVAMGKAASRLGRFLLTWTTLYTLSRVAESHGRQVSPLGVDFPEGRLIIRLATDSSVAVTEGEKFEVLNTASGRILGTLEVTATEDTSCLCQVFDRIDTDFWQELEERARSNPAPPSGVTFSRALPEGFWDFVQKIVGNWGG